MLDSHMPAKEASVTRMGRVERLGKYELLRHLASGGMARVYLARVDGVGGFARHLVLKTVRRERTEDASYVSMFLDEARLVATLHHQHVAQVYDVGIADDGTYYMAMEYLHGETVRAVLERARDLRERLPLDFSLTVVAAACAGLHHAHERRGPDGRPLGIVHRDVTPSNVIAGYDGSVKLIDFGIAKAVERSTTTKTGFIKGKAGYMAPEQALGQPVDRRADVFSLGVVLYELTTQTRAFPAASELEVAHRIVRGEVTPPSVAVTGYPSELEDVIMTALARDPDERFGDAEAFGHALEYAASHLGLAPGPSAVSRVLSQLFGTKPEPWLTAAAEVEDDDPSRTGDTASLLDSRPLLATTHNSGPVQVGFARGTGAQVQAARAAPESASPPPQPAPPPMPRLADAEFEEGDEIPTVKFLALDEAEIIIEHAPQRAVRVAQGQSAGQIVARVLAPLPGLTVPPPQSPVFPRPATARPATTPPPITPRPSSVLSPPSASASAITAKGEPKARPVIALPRPPHGSQPPPFEAPVMPAVATILPPPPVAAMPMRLPKASSGPIGVRTEPVMAFGAYEAMVAKRNRMVVPLIAVAGAAMAAAVFVVGVIVLGGSGGASAPARSPLAEEIAPPVEHAAKAPDAEIAAPAQAAAETTSIEVRVTTTPDDATVMLGGERLGRTPIVLERPRAPGKVWLKVRKRGYSTRKIEVDLGSDVVWEVSLPKGD